MPFNINFYQDQIRADSATAVPGVNRVVYDITSKPTGTIEWK